VRWIYKSKLRVGGQRMAKRDYEVFFEAFFCFGTRTSQ
jgi:hypothetical protein